MRSVMPAMKNEKAIVYTILEDPVEGYEFKITEDPEKGYVVTNIHDVTPPTPSRCSGDLC